MSRAVRKNFFYVISLLRNATNQFPEIISKIPSNKENVLGLLADCQCAAIALGSAMEELQIPSVKKLVSILEQYCEYIYQIAEHYNSLELVLEKSKQAIQLMRDLGIIFQEEYPDKLEIVFLPYKASMWDSLESVWKKANDNPQYDAYVIPIPYYDKAADGSFKEMHYEGDLYPSYVPVMDYKDYDFEKRKPDRVYIHNPYDETNYVTSVEPFYYSKNLIKYTDELIYIPYFVLGEIDPANVEAVEKIKHFCTVPAVVYANKVIVQSENMRKIYIDVLTQNAGEESRKVWEEKILGSGSPKFDKISNTRNFDNEIKKEWLEVIRKKDGNWKKIIFYNTSVNALLKYNEKFLKKIQDVFRIFQKHKDEVVLLWRPHPLMQATLESMRPQLSAAYCELVEEYRNAGWGIYDDTAELGRAISLCDAYYGDQSSVVQLCQKAGKPIMIQNIEEINE